MKNRIALVVVVGVCIMQVACQPRQGRWNSLLEKQGKWNATVTPSTFAWNEEGLVCSGEPGYLVWEGGKPYVDFELVAEIQTAPGSFAQILFHQSLPFDSSTVKGYGVVVAGSTGQVSEPALAMKTGSLYGIRNLYYPMVADGEWFTLTVRVSGNLTETFVNGTRVMEYIQPGQPWRGSATGGRLLSSGTFAVHHQAGTVKLKSLKVRPLPPGEQIPLKVEETWDAQVTRLMEAHFPLIDFHVHLKGGLTIEQAIENSQQLGINYGIAPNCGLKFPVTDDISLAAYMDTVRGKPIFRGMQAEGREWITLFSPEAIAKFDYVFTDALTFTDYKGRRNRIWIPEEVWVDNKQQFMDQLTGKIEAIFSQEPVDIYVNPTLLPASLKPEYDQLWTPERIDRVIAVLKKNNVAIEINARYKIPSPAFIRKAKEAGLKFSFGTNNGAANLGRLEYCLQMIDECGLTPADMFFPKVHEEKPVLVKGLPPAITG